MLLGRLTPCTRLACPSYWSCLSGSLPRASALTVQTFSQCAVRTASNYNVGPFGKFVFDGPGNVNVAPVNLQKFPNMDQCTVSCDADDSDTRWSVSAEEGMCSIISDSKEKTSGTWSVCLPIKYDVEVRSAASVTISGLECSRASVKASDEVTLTGVKAGHVDVNTPGAVRVNKLLLGNVTLEAEEVDSSGARLQGQTVTVSARSTCHLSDIYADRARLEVRSGDLRVGTIHADATVTTAGTGEVVIGGVDGSINLSAPASSSVRCHVNRLNSDSRLSSGGALHLTLAAGVGCTLRVLGPPPELDSRLGATSAGGASGAGGVEVTVAGGGPVLQLESPQPAQVQLQDWAAAVAGWAR